MGPRASLPENADWKTILARWVFGQEAVVVILVAILVAIGWLAYYAITIGVPTHLAQIQAGYEKIVGEAKVERLELVDRQKVERAEMSATHTERLRLLVEEATRDREAKDRWFRTLSERLERRVGASAAVKPGFSDAGDVTVK